MKFSLAKPYFYRNRPKFLKSFFLILYYIINQRFLFLEIFLFLQFHFIEYHFYTGCGGFVDATVKTSGTIAHPSYPNNYRSQVECEYVISTLPGKTITLSFEEFRLESSNFCKYDFLEVRDGKNEKAGSVGKFCGDKKPSPLTSSGNHLYFKFFSDENTVDKGFLAKWTVGVENTFPTVGPNTGLHFLAISLLPCPCKLIKPYFRIKLFIP